MAEHNELGLLGEEKAADYLLSKGYVIRDRNWRSGKFELDIVAQRGDMLVVVEVKTRREGFLERPSAAVTRMKIRNTIYAAESYIFRKNIMVETRFDIIEVIVSNGGECEIIHIEDAFLPGVN